MAATTATTATASCRRSTQHVGVAQRVGEGSRLDGQQFLAQAAHNNRVVLLPEPNPHGHVFATASRATTNELHLPPFFVALLALGKQNDHLARDYPVSYTHLTLPTIYSV